MPEFTVKERQAGEPCFVAWEDVGVYIELKPPADLEHARSVAKFLNENIDSVTIEPGRDFFS